MSKKREQAIKGKAIMPKKNLTDKLDEFFSKNEKNFVFLSLILCTITSILLFDIKVSLSGDDCDYIIAAGELWKDFTYPGHHAPLYPMLLSPFIGIFGINLFLLKFLSTIFIVASLWLFYKSFQRIIPAIVLIPTLILVSINPYVMFFASYTYSEPFFLLMQALFFYFFSKYFWKSSQEYNIKKDWKKYLIMAFIIMGVGLTRTIGFSVIGVIVIYFIIVRRWKDLAYTTSVFTIIFCLCYFAKPVIWPESSSVQSFETLLAKNPYVLIQGSEDFSGLIKRVIENSHIYLSGFLYKYFGFRSSSDLPLQDIPPLSMLTYALFTICLISVFKKNKPLLFIGIYTGSLIFASFVLLHVTWAQDRMIMIYYPYILLFLIGGFYYLFARKAFSMLSFCFPLILISLLFGTGIHAKNRIERNLYVLQQNILGNDLYGLTPDWENFIKMSRWANDNLDKDAVIASRKPSISYVYTGRVFHGIYSVPNLNLDDVINEKLQVEEEGKNTFLIVEMIPNNHILNNLDPYIKFLITTKAGGTFSINNKRFNSAIVYKLDKSLVTDGLIRFLNTNNFNYTFDYNAFFNQYVEDNSILYQIIDPDVVVKQLTDNNIRYLVLAKIRVYTSQDTGYFINTLHQFISFIQLKYPGKFNLIHTIGKDESCELVEFLGK